MTYFRSKIDHKDPSARWMLMNIDKMTAGACTDAAGFTSDDNVLKLFCLM